MLCAMINKPKTVFKLCSHYWFNEVIAIEVTEKLNYLRLFRVLLMRFNPYNAALKCLEPFNYARVVFELSDGKEVLPSGCIVTAGTVYTALPPLGENIGPPQPEGYLEADFADCRIPIVLAKRLYDIAELADDMYTNNLYLQVDMLLKHRYLIHIKEFDGRVKR